MQKQLLSCRADSLPAGMEERGRKLGLIVEPFAGEDIREKPFSHTEERWQIFPDRGADSWIGSVFVRLVDKHRLDHLILISLANPLIDRSGVSESLQLHQAERFDATWSEDRLTGANWVIFSGELLRGLQKSHPDLMATRGGLSWCLRKPLYPFRLGEFHCPRSAIPIQIDCSLHSRFQDLLSRPEASVLAEPDFSYEQWMKNDWWIREFTGFAPRHVVVELTNQCSGNCFGCPQPHQTRSMATLARPLFDRIVSSLSGIADLRWILSGMGEPILHPDFSVLSSALRHRHLMLITSLLQPLPPDFDWNAFDLIRVSVDAVERPSFETFRPGCHWGNVEAFLKEGHRRKLAEPEFAPEIGVPFLRHQKNSVMASEFLRYWKQICHPAFRTDFFLWPRDATAEKVQWFQILGASDFLGKQPKLFPVSYVPVTRRLCRHALLGMHILADGRVTICPFDVDGKYILGDINRDDPLDIWRSDRAGEFRQSHLNRGFSPNFPCQNCQEWYHPE